MGTHPQQSPMPILNNQHLHHHPSSGGVSSSSSAATAGPRAKCDQVVYEALCKACEIIVGSRTSTAPSSGVGATTTSSTPRFNIQIPEVAGVRSILSQYRLQLHVPIRLDVYCQHPPNTPDEAPRRELLERWCLEYKPNTHQYHPQQSNNNSNSNATDPMVQLTHVCKRVVVWLRTLYCWTRMLPASAMAQQHQQQQQQQRYNNSNALSIGFAIYVNTDGSQDDVSDLMTRQGFISNSSSSSNRGSSSSSSGGGTIVLTPYGELSWQVVYAPPSQLERHLPPPLAMRTVRMQIPADAVTRSGTSSSSRPIPLPRNVHHHHRHSDYNTNNDDDATRLAPHSAPLYGGAAARGLTYTERSQQKQWEAQQHRRSRQPFWQSSGKSFDPSGLLHSTPERQQQQQVGATTPTTMSHHQRASSVQTKSSADANPPRVMSGLSLALLMASNDDDHLADSPTPAPEPHAADDHNNNHDVSPDESGVVMVYSDDGQEETAEEAKRRAALHQVPPHFVPQASTGEYGYGYNNHIPWQKIHPSQSHPTNTATTSSTSVSRQPSFGRTLSSSPGSYTASPLRAPPTPPALCNNTLKLDSLGAHLIPPRSGRSSESKSSNSSVALPPFPPRPAGFLQEAASFERSGHTMGLMMGLGGEEMSASKLATSPATRERTSSLDLLRSSPFVASSSVGDPQQPMVRDSLLASTADADLLRRSLWSTSNTAAGLLTSSTTGGALFSNGAAFPNYPPHPLDPPVDSEDSYWSEEMPFAVELLPSPAPSFCSTTDSTLPGKSDSKSNFGAGGSSFLGNSAAASLAQKCATGQHHPRLKLLDSSRIISISQQQKTSHCDSLADQLQELRAFGASLRLGEEQGSLSGSGSSAAANPITLRS